jgi:hypothetical protein
MKKNLLVVSIVLITLITSFFYVNRTKEPVQNRTVLQLSSPSFVSQAKAGSELQTYLDQEAGIAAWCQVDPINLENLKDNTIWVTLEIETNPEYLIGTIAIPNYPDQYNPHVYVHIDGWIMAYYPNDDPTSKIIDLQARNLNTTILNTAVGLVANVAGSACSGVSYYDFRYPNATHLLLVAEDDNDGNYFTIEMPASYDYIDRGWAWWTGGNVPTSNDFCRLTLGEVVLNLPPRATWTDGKLYYGDLLAYELVPDETYTFTVNGYWGNSYGALIITYGMP